MEDLVVNTILIFYLQMSNTSMSNNYKNEGLEIQRSKDDMLGISVESTIIFT
jgi:hypothetical protein